MDNNRIDGPGHEGVRHEGVRHEGVRQEGVHHEVKGSTKEQAGSAAGNLSEQLEGNIEKHAGRAEQMIDAMARRMRGGDAKR